MQSIGVAAATDEQQILLDAYGSYADVLAANGELAAAVFYGKFAVNLAQQMRNDVSALGRAVQKSFLAKRQHTIGISRIASSRSAASPRPSR